MARFFFHFFDGNDHFDDECGLELPSADHAYLEAVNSATGMWGDLLSNRIDPSECSFEIANSTGSIINRLQFAEILENCRPVSMARLPSKGVIRSLAETHEKATNAVADISITMSQVRKSLAEAKLLLAKLDSIQGSSDISSAVPRSVETGIFEV